MIPREYTGKWIAWSGDGMRILAAADTSTEAERLGIEAGEPEPILEVAPGPYRR